jgi:hypothetical protein
VDTSRVQQNYGSDNYVFDAAMVSQRQNAAAATETIHWTNQNRLDDEGLQKEDDGLSAGC